LEKSAGLEKSARASNPRGDLIISGGSDRKRATAVTRPGAGHHDALSAHGVRVRRLRLADPVHARAPEIELFDCTELIGITLGGGQSPSMAEIDLLADVSLGTTRLAAGERRYELSLRTIRIVLDTENAELRPGTAYRLVLQAGTYEASEAEKRVATRALHGEIGAGTGLAAKIVAWLPTFSAHADVDASASAAAKRTAELTAQTRAVRLVELVRTDGQNAWIAGEPDGDPRRPQTRDLRGEVISARDGERLTPLCGLSATEPARPVAGRLSVHVRDTGFALHECGPEAALLERLFASLRADERQAMERRLRAERALRKRVAALALVRRRGGEPRSDTVSLASCAFGFEPDLDDGTQA
jgi:hypothetical protein